MMKIIPFVLINIYLISFASASLDFNSIVDGILDMVSFKYQVFSFPLNLFKIV